MAKTIWQCVTAIICVAVISLTTMSGLNGIAEAKIAAAEKYAESAQNAGSNVGDNAGSTDTITPDAGTDAVTPDAGTDAVTPDAGTDATTPDAGTDATTPDAGTDATKPGADAGSKAPSSKADIVACYNSAINKVVSSKAGFKKMRETEMHNLEGGALLNIPIVVEMVNDFLGVGTEPWDNKKGEQNNLSKASLTEADLTGATCVDKNGIYTITLNLKDGASSAKTGAPSTDTSPLQRSGVFAGKGDKKAYDYKNSENIHTAINGVDNCTAESAIEKVTNTKIVAVIDSKTGKLQSLTASWDWYVELTKVKYTLVGIDKAKGNATTTVKLTNVQW